MSSPMNAIRVPRWKAAAPALAPSTGEFHELLSFDLSPLEKRFDHVFARLDALEHALLIPNAGIHANDDGDIGGPAGEDEAVGTILATAPTEENLVAVQRPMVAIGKGDLAKELEELHATQLRLKIQHELAQATYKVDMEALQRDLLTLPQHADLQNFRAEVDVLLTSTMKSLSDQQMLLWQDVERSLAGRDLAENQWKAHFEDSMNTRIQDVWAGLQASQRKADEALGSLQSDMFKVEAATRETVDSVDKMQHQLEALEKRTAAQEVEGIAHDHAIAQLHVMLRQTNSDMAAQDAVLQRAMDELSEQAQTAEQRHTHERDAHDAFVADTEKTLQVCTNEIQTTIRTALQTHHDKLLTLDVGLTKLSAELRACQDHGHKTDTRMGALDGRLVMQEKQTATLTHVLQEQHHEMNRHVGDLHKSLELAMQDRVAIKRTATEQSFMVQEVQQTLQEVTKMASTTELSLTRTAAEIPKLHVLATTNTSNIVKCRQALADVMQHVFEEKTLTHQLHQSFENEVHASVHRFADLVARDEATQQRIVTTNSTMHHVKHTLEEAIKYNSHMIHQLNSMVDALAITESPTGMDDKLARFTLETAELGLKLEHFVVSTPGGGGGHTSSTITASGVVLVRDEVKAELAVLLTKIIRFLGSGVSIDQNKYFLSASKLVLPSHDPASGALVFELPASNMLDQIRSTKVTQFVTKLRVFLDQLRPVAQSVRHVHEFRDHFERSVRYVLEFGLANLFPNHGRPRNPNRKNPNAGTCIACDRPLEEEDEDEVGRECIRIIDTLDPEVAAVDDQKQRRNKLLTSTTTAGPVASAGMTHKINTRTPVRGRSGGLPPSTSTPQQRPRSALTTSCSTAGGIIATGNMFHHAPGTNDYVYRAGFRLPRQAIGDTAKTANAEDLAALRGLVVATGSAGGLAQDDPVNAKQTLDDTMSSCLEKVALVGKHSDLATVEVPNPTVVPPSPIATSPSTSQILRPHTAPLRSRSLPRLQVVIERASGP